MTLPFIPPPADTEQSQSPDAEEGGHPSAQEGEPEPEPEPATTSFSAPPTSRTVTPPPASPPPLTVHTDITLPTNPLSPQGHADSYSASDNSSSDSSIELVNLETDGWDQERRLGVPLPRRVEREFYRLQVAESTTALVPHPPRLFERREDLIHDRCSHCGSPKPSDCDNTDLPSHHSGSQPESSSPPSSPKGRKWKRLFIPTTGSHATENPPLSPTPSSPRSPKFGFLSAALASTLTLSTNGSPGPSKPFVSHPPTHRKEGSVVRRLFSPKVSSPKGKERDTHGVVDEPSSKASLEDWEVVDRSTGDSDGEASPGPGLSSASEGSDQSHQEYRMVERIHRSAVSNRPSPTPSPARSDTPPAFINRAVRHSPQNVSPFPMFASNSSVVSLPLAGSAAFEGFQTLHPSSSTLDVFTEHRQTSSPLAPRRKAVSTLRASPSVVWLPLLKSPATGGDQDSCTLPPMLPSQGPQLLPQPSIQELQMSRPHNIPHQRNLSPLAQPFESALSGPVLSIIPAMHVASSSSMTESPIRGYAHTPTALRAPTLRSPASAMTLNSSQEIPSTPTTPTRHYHGRPLPQPPGQLVTPERLMVTPSATHATLPHTPSPSVDHIASTELDLLAARIIEGDHGDGTHYEVRFFSQYDRRAISLTIHPQDLLRISEVAGTATSLTTTPVQLPPTARVELKRRRVTKDGRVRLKMTLMDTVVDKCGICLSQFKEAEVACHGTNCRHT